MESFGSDTFIDRLEQNSMTVFGHIGCNVSVSIASINIVSLLLSDFKGIFRNYGTYLVH